MFWNNLEEKLNGMRWIERNWPMIERKQILLGDGGNVVAENEYDVVTISGGFVPGHVPMAAIHDLVRMCKSGELSYFDECLCFDIYVLILHRHVERVP